MTISKPKILIVDDETEITESLALVLRHNYEVTAVNTVDLAKKELGSSPEFAVIITDLNFHGQNLDGLDLIEWVSEREIEVPVIVLSGDQDIRRVVSAQKRIQDDFIVKPFELSEIRCAIEKARQRIATAPQRANRILHEVVTQDSRIHDALAKVRKVIESSGNLSICIYGESGTGKEEIAKYAASVRGGPYVALNLAAIPADVAESELFGSVNGAYTGARDRIGKFQAAHKGVLLLDEIGDCPLPLQVKLFRALQERSVTRVGSTKEEPVDVKVICATNQPLHQMVGDGRFRPELLARVEGQPIVLPPLRERIDDIPLLVGKFLRDLNTNKSRPASISQDALLALEDYSWPGNVRELRTVIERALLMANSREITVEHLVRAGFGTPLVVTPSVASNGRNLNYSERIRQAEARLFREAIREAKGSKITARKLLGLPHTTFFRKLRDLGLDREAGIL